MKRVVILFLAIALIGCAKSDEESVGAQSKTPEIAKSNLGFFDSHEIMILVNGTWERASESVLENYWKNAVGNAYPVGQQLANFRLVTSDPDESGNTSVFLMANSETNTFSIGTALEGSGPSFRIVNNKTCTCSGCPNGCNLQTSGSTCYCSGCNPSSGECTKTETQTVDS